ncbi:MAG TPA: hypothetical protein VFS54_02000 [Solirubrobacterales bacterium]|nr:hypothetical protein [Solirubrobacterales bacterium]
MRKALLLALALAAVGAASAPVASATKPCRAIHWEEHKVKVGVIGVDCASARERIESFYERWNPVNGPRLHVEGFRCAGTSAGADVFCHSGDRWIYATTRPYADVTRFHPLRSQGIRRTCGTLPGDGAYSYITTVGTRCAPAKRIAFRARKRFCKRHNDCLIVPPTPISTIYKGRVGYHGWACHVKDGWELLVVGCKKRDMRFTYRTAA